MAPLVFLGIGLARIEFGQYLLDFRQHLVDDDFSWGVGNAKEDISKLESR